MGYSLDERQASFRLAGMLALSLEAAMDGGELEGAGSSRIAAYLQVSRRFVRHSVIIW